MALGEKIQKLRKQQGLSQEALAEKIAVTRQTVSKWELGQSAPDLNFVVQLSGIFGVSCDYLMKEHMLEPDPLLCNNKKRCLRLSERGKQILFILFSAASLAAICICLICDYFTGEYLSWSLIAAAAITAAWIVALPFLTAKTNILRKTLAALSAVPIPLLAILALVLNVPLVFTMGSCIALVAIAAVWILYGIFLKFRRNLWRAFGFALLVMVPVPIAVIGIVARFIPEIPLDMTSSVFNSGITLALSLPLFGLDYFYSRGREEAQR